MVLLDQWIWYALLLPLAAISGSSSAYQIHWSSRTMP